MHCEQITYPGLPLAVYREIASHCQQLAQVDTLLLSAQVTQFDYAESQIGGLQIQFPVDLTTANRQQLEAILAFYGERYGLPIRKVISADKESQTESLRISQNVDS